ncbi:MAG: efflux RND transporter permease subunit, partial [Desulfobulbaceae bacterium]|nr:efflux RND transporter permease subunit [Desulfobulbaceae bacterium]
LTVGDVQDVIMSAVGGMQVSQTIEGLERYSINVRYPRDFRDNPDKISRVLVPTPGGTHIPLSEVTDIALTRGAPVIKSENARPNAWVYVDISTSDIGGFVKKAKEVMAEELKLPAGYTLIWSGQFEYMKRAQERLRIVVPFTLVLIFLMLYLNFRNLAEPIIVMLSIPFALVGGIWLIWIMNFNLSVAIVVGFIALAGVAAEIGVLVLTFIDHELERQRKNTAGRKMSSKEIMAAVYTGTSERVRPIAMTSIATIAGLLPILYGKGTGSQVMQRIAAPMVGGMVTTTLLCLLVIPVIYGFYLQVGERFRKE